MFKRCVILLVFLVAFLMPLGSVSHTYWIEMLVNANTWGENLTVMSQGEQDYEQLSVDPRTNPLDAVKKANPGLQKKLPELLDAKTHIFLNKGKSNVVGNGMSSISETLYEELRASLNVPVSEISEYFDTLYATGGYNFSNGEYKSERRIFIESLSRSDSSAEIYFGDDAHAEISGQLPLGTLMTFLPLPALPDASLSDEGIAWACVVRTFDQEQSFGEAFGSDAGRIQKTSVWGLPAYIQMIDLLGANQNALDSVGRSSGSIREDTCPNCGARLSSGEIDRQLCDSCEKHFSLKQLASYQSTDNCPSCGVRLSVMEVGNLHCDTCGASFQLSQLPSYQESIRRGQEEQEAFRKAASTPDSSNVLGRFYIVNIDLTDWVIPSETPWKTHTVLTFLVLGSKKTMQKAEGLYNKFVGGAGLSPAEIVVVDSWTEGLKANLVDKRYASEEAGEDEGVDFPAFIVEGLAAGVAAVAGGAVGSFAAGGAAGETGPLDDDERKKRRFLRMRLNKDFGDTLALGGAAREVYARLSMVDGEGNETERPDLTAQMRCFSPDGSLIVKDGGMSRDGRYKVAVVSVPEQDYKAEGILSFQYSGEGGDITRETVFNISEPTIKFSQESLTLPALYEPEEMLEFKVEGMNLETTEITAYMSGGKLSSYEVNVATTPETAAKGLYAAIIKDVNSKAGIPGTYSTETLYVSATDGKLNAYGSIKVNRVTEGLYISLDAVNCYGEPKPGAVKNEMGFYDLESLQSAKTEALAWILTIDRETGAIVQTSASPRVSFTSVRPQDADIQDGECMFETSQLEGEPDTAQTAEKLGIVMRVSDRTGGMSTCEFFCGHEFLRSPARLVAYMIAEADTGEGEDKQTFKCVKQVLLRSQRRRTFEEITAAKAKDAEIERRMEVIINYMRENNAWLDEAIFWAYNTATLHWQSYDPEYGYAEDQTSIIWETFRARIDEKQGYLERAQRIANEYATNFTYFDAILDTFRERSSTIPGILARITIGVLSAGASEFVFLPMDVASAVHEYNKVRLPEERTVMGQMTAGSVPVLFAAAFACAPGAAKLVFVKGSKALLHVGKASYNVGKAALGGNKVVLGKAISGLGKTTRAAGRYMTRAVKTEVRGMTEGISKSLQNTVEKVKLLDPRNFFKRWNSAANQTNQAVANGIRNSQLTAAEIRAMKKTLDQELMSMADQIGSLNGFKSVKDFQRLAKQLGNGEGKGLKEQILAMMKDPHAVEQLAKMEGAEGRELRRIFNLAQDRLIYNPVQEETLATLARTLRKNPSNLRFRSVSSKSKEALRTGKALRHDLDVTVEEFVNGEWVPLKQNEVHDVYHQVFCRRNGIQYASPEEASLMSEMHMQHVCQDASDREFLHEVEKVIDKSQAMENAISSGNRGKVADTLGYKMRNLYEQGKLMGGLGKMSEAEKKSLLKEMEAYYRRYAETGIPGDLSKCSRQFQNLVKGTGLQREGMRASSKVLEQTKWKNTGAMQHGAPDSIPQDVYNDGAIIDDMIGQTPNRLDVGEAEAVLAPKGGYEGHTYRMQNSYVSSDGNLEKGLKSGKW